MNSKVQIFVEGKLVKSMKTTRKASQYAAINIIKCVSMMFNIENKLNIYGRTSIDYKDEDTKQIKTVIINVVKGV